MRILGLDPGLRITGWGVIDMVGSKLTYVAHGTCTSDAAMPISERLLALNTGVSAVIDEWHPDEAALEETFVNKNPESTLKLGIARGAVILAPASRGLPVSEYAPNRVKKTVVGTGHAAKEQIQMMVKTLLPGSKVTSADAADALAVAICHAHFAQGRRTMELLRMAAR